MMLKNLLANIKKEKLRKERKKTAKKIALGTISGIAAGVASGVLLAPKSGKETRKDIVGAATEINSKIKEGAVTAKGNLQNKGEEFKSNVVDAKEKISNYLNEKKAKKDCCSANNEEAIIEEEVEEKDLESKTEENN
jgi:gas vesicle protein